MTETADSAVIWPKAVIFDLDGTLIDSAADIAAALNGAVGTRGLPPFSMEQVTQMIGGGLAKLIERAFLAHGVREDDLMPFIREFLAHYERNCLDQTTLYGGALPAIQRLHNRGVKLAICTNKQQGMTERIIEGLDLQPYFASIVGEKLGRPRKPDPAQVNLCLAELGVSASDAVLVGDSAADAGAAAAANVPCVLVTYGYTNVPVQSLAANGVIEHLDHLDGALIDLRNRAGWPLQQNLTRAR